MSRLLSLGVSVGALFIAASAAQAADLSKPYAPPPAAYSPTPAANWTGPYAGLVGGYAWGGGTAANNGWLGGVYLGMNYQTPSNWVFGAEGDLTLTGKSGGGITNPWNTTFRGRIGYALSDNVLLYGTGGLAVGGLNSTVPESATKIGWTVGGGIEARLTQNVTGRLEYRHTNLGTFPTGGSAYTSNDLMVGVGLRF